jgi:hypothetical protein
VTPAATVTLTVKPPEVMAPVYAPPRKLMIAAVEGVMAPLRVAVGSESITSGNAPIETAPLHVTPADIINRTLTCAEEAASAPLHLPDGARLSCTAPAPLETENVPVHTASGRTRSDMRVRDVLEPLVGDTSVCVCDITSHEETKKKKNECVRTRRFRFGGAVTDLLKVADTEQRRAELNRAQHQTSGTVTVQRSAVG